MKKRIRMTDARKCKNKQDTIIVRRIVEYSDLFTGESPLDIPSTLKLFSRNMLIRAAAVLSLHYGNLCIPDNYNTLFSESSQKHIGHLNKLFKAYYKKYGIEDGQEVQILTYRTGLELWRQIFAIREEEFTNSIATCDFEFFLFKVILTINERLLNFNEKNEFYKLDELLFLNGFLTNDSNNYHLPAILQPQMYYFQQLINFIPTNEVLSKASEKLLNNWGIATWQQYFTTIVTLAYQTDQYIKDRPNGVPIIKHDLLQNNQDSSLLSASLLEHLSIKEDEYIPINDEVHSQKDLNIDYRRFRAKPFVKLKDDTGYIVINNQLLCERLFNSLYFDFMPFIDGNKKSFGYFDYNKDFIEKVLFRSTFFNCIPYNNYTFPTRKNHCFLECPHEPDFYTRTKRGELILVECKAIKMNGECRDDGDYVRLLNELHEKIVIKTKNLDKNRKEYKGKPEPIGIGQLIHHIDSIEANEFQWDSNIPDEVIYYPILVFEDVKLVQRGILSMINRWFIEEVKKEKELSLKDIACMPVMVVSINTLYLYNKLLLRKGLTHIIDLFVKENAVHDEHTGTYRLTETADFDAYLRRNPFNKSKDAIKWIKNFVKPKG